MTKRVPYKGREIICDPGDEQMRSWTAVVMRGDVREQTTRPLDTRELAIGEAQAWIDAHDEAGA
jgi:hypothetical protein